MSLHRNVESEEALGVFCHTYRFVFKDNVMNDSVRTISDGLNKNVLHRLEPLDICFPIGDAL